MKYLKPSKLNPGDTVAVISPSWGGPSVFPHVYENGLKVLRGWGLKIKEYPTTRADADFLRVNPKTRAKDIDDAFADSEVRAIIASIGGDDSVRILPYLDKAIVQSNPKILMGYSDTTALHVYCNQLGLVTFHGPSVMAGFSQMKALSENFALHVHEMLFEPKAIYEYKPYEKYCDGYPDWKNQENTGKVNELKPSDGWRWLQGGRSVQGELFGGNMEVLEMMKATDFWPIRDFWNGKIFFLETSEEKPSLQHVDHELRNYGAQGVFDKISALLIGRARDYSDGEKQKLDELLVSIVSKEFDRSDLPIVTNMDFGHTDPQIVLPLGVKAEVNCQEKKLRLIEQPLQ